MGSQIPGNLISAYALDALGAVYYTLIMMAIAIMSCVLFTILRKPYSMARPVSLRVVEEIMRRESGVENHMKKRQSY
jgi:hypothetical protein